jgi:hypothetical protein
MGQLGAAEVTRDEIVNMPAGREMDVTVGYHVMDLVAPPELYPPYSTDIAAAWQVWLKVMDKMPGLYITAHTAPLAICRAALLIVWDAKHA